MSKLNELQEEKSNLSWRLQQLGERITELNQQIKILEGQKARMEKHAETYRDRTRNHGLDAARRLRG
jgi:predicted nuclease with TOPRIM domain